MEQPAQPAPSASSFAGLLASFTSAARAKDRQPDWSVDELGDDVVTLSYENALRAHTRYKPQDLRDWASAPEKPGAMPAASATLAESDHPFETDTGISPHMASDGGLRSASVTVRLTAAECARLRQRSAEAGLTISAYLRSCTFEVESLRAQVKETLATLKSAAAPESAGVTAHRGWQQWLAGLAHKRRRPGVRP